MNRTTMGHGKKQTQVLLSLPLNGTREMKYTKSVSISFSKSEIFISNMMPTIHV